MLSPKVLAAFFILILAPFSFAQSCYTSFEQVLELTHPKDNSDYYFIIDSSWQYKNADGVKIFYDKGTSLLTLQTGSIQSTLSDLPNKVKIIFSTYNNTSNYSVTTPWTQTTIAGLPAFYIEFEDKTGGSTTFGKTAVIFGAEAEGSKKYYAITLSVRQLSKETEMELFNKAYKTFSLDPPAECETTPEPTPDDPKDPGSDDTDGPSGPTPSAGDSGDDTGNGPGTATPPPRPPQNNSPPAEEFTIFGFSPLIIIGAIVLLGLIGFFILVMIIIIAVLVYYAFFKKKDSGFRGGSGLS